MVDDRGRDDIERQLQGYFAAERDELRAPSDLWATISARLGEQDPAPWWRRMFGGATQGMGRVYAGAAAALAVAVVGAVMYTALVGLDDSTVSQESMASDAPSTTAATTMAAAAPALPPTAAPAAAPVAAAAEMAPAAAMMDAAAVPESVPRTPAELTQNAAAAMPQAEEPPFRLEMWGLQNGVRTHLFWVDLPDGWISGAPMLVNGEWTGAFSGRGVTLHYTFGERAQTEMLRTNTRSEAAAQQKRMWDEYVIGNLAFIVAPPEDTVGDMLMTLQLPSGTLRLTGEALAPEQQEWALVIFRSIIA